MIAAPIISLPGEPMDERIGHLSIILFAMNIPIAKPMLLAKIMRMNMSAIKVEKLMHVMDDNSRRQN